MTISKRIDLDERFIPEALWEFRTARYTVALFAEDEDMSPADSFCDERDIAYASDGDPDGERIGHDYLGGCSYGSFREFYSAHRWQYSRRQRRYIEDPKSRAWKACEARRPRRPHGLFGPGELRVDDLRIPLSDDAGGLSDGKPS